MDEAQIAMLIATGRTELKAGSGGVGTSPARRRARPRSARSRRRRSRTLVADKLPLDTVAFDSGARGPRAGKYVTDKIYVGYMRALRGGVEEGREPERGPRRVPDHAALDLRVALRRRADRRRILIWSKDY